MAFFLNWVYLLVDMLMIMMTKSPIFQMGLHISPRFVQKESFFFPFVNPNIIMIIHV